MEKILINKPGKYEIKLSPSKKGEDLRWFGIVDAREIGEYGVNLVLTHKEPNTFGRVEIKGVVENGAKVKINGLVRVEKNAEKTDSFLSMKVLLLDGKSKVILEPELEIKNDNVKASHSASAGKIDPEQLFYLKSRGIEEKEAKNIIVKGFLEEIYE